MRRRRVGAPCSAKAPVRSKDFSGRPRKDLLLRGVTPFRECYTLSDLV